MKPDWSTPLTAPVTLKDGTVLVTLKDAADLIAERFSGMTHSALMEGAIADLIRAAESGRAGDRRQATEQFRRLLKFRELV